jgi:DUF1680 family protein
MIGPSQVVAIQEPDGYLNTYFDGEKKPLRMLYRDANVRPRVI